MAKTTVKSRVSAALEGNGAVTGTVGAPEILRTVEPPRGRTRDWQAVLPDRVARAQVAWDRRSQIVQAIDEGVARGEIADAMDVSRQWVNELALHQGQLTNSGRLSPVEAYLSMTAHMVDLAVLAQCCPFNAGRVASVRRATKITLSRHRHIDALQAMLEHT